MNTTILTISERGQITLPANLRKKIKSKHLTVELNGDAIVLRSLQTREEFLEEIEEIRNDYNKNGGKAWEDIKKEYLN